MPGAIHAARRGRAPGRGLAQAALPHHSELVVDGRVTSSSTGREPDEELVAVRQYCWLGGQATAQR